MEAEFWHERWGKGEIGFHKSRPNPLLSRWWPALGLPEGATVWVPLCGKSLDMAWLRQRGHPVLGIELARSALESFAAEQQLQLGWRQQGEFAISEGEGYCLYCGDFFGLQTEDVASVKGIYDRAALIALPEKMRHRYVAHMRHILPPGWQLLLITLDYPQQQRPGPPFSVPDAEVRSLFAGCRIELLDEQDVLDDHAVFREQGMTQLQERVYRIST
ncbi:thiopurine S-methyltransferase [Halopseudomonas salegens]|uniref:Thiopurine S-methyltransferase n=1 Tax=Halopseudomonas salegens TaxID=1434072 RepID=A0A1H2GCM1_9GAMM|nr:thiopurine S-methyltransferase [Halopseudomonas salegens]SDU17138.1 thiopurine S-methyltransferase [Halopseudomonas salegens]